MLLQLNQTFLPTVFDLNFSFFLALLLMHFPSSLPLLTYPYFWFPILFFFFLVFSSYHHFFHFPFHPLSLPGGHLGRCDLWPAVSERVRVRERDREWKWGGGLEQGPTETSSRLQHPVPLPRPGPPPNVWGKHLQSCHVIISVMHFFMLTKSTSSNLVRSSTWKLSSMREGLRWVSMLEHSQICN